MLVAVSCPVTLVNNQAISRKGFLNEPTCNLVMSLRTTAGFSRNSSKRSNPLSSFYTNSLQSPPLEPKCWLEKSQHLTKYPWRQKDRGMVPQLNDPLAWNISLDAPCNQLLTVENLRDAAYTSNSRRPYYFLLGKRG